MSTIQRSTSPNDSTMCRENAAILMSVDATKTVADNIEAAQNSAGREAAPVEQETAAALQRSQTPLDAALDRAEERPGINSSGHRGASDSVESARDVSTLNEVARDTAAVLSTLDALGVDTFATSLDVMHHSIPVGGVGMVAGFMVHATDTRPVTDSAVLNLSNAVTHTAVDTIVDGVFGGAAVAENLLGSAAAFMPVGSGGRAMLEGAQQVMPTAQVRGGLYAVADLQTAGQSALVDAVRGDGPGGLYQSGDAIAASARAGDYGGVARLLQDSVDILVPEQLGAPTAGGEFRFLADAR
ncbi:MAG: hypothetical protein ACI81R_003575 [Bradymonadia bacterium]|jgi:hypothetical protein